MGGALLSCPRCGSTQLDTRQTVAEELLEHELDRTRLVFCPYKVTTSLNNCTSSTCIFRFICLVQSVGCSKITRAQLMGNHRDTCLFRPVKCPKVTGSNSGHF